MSSAVLQVDFITLPKVEDTFPISVATAFTPSVVQVARIVNKYASVAAHYEAVWCDWEPVSGGIKLRYVTGLAPGYAYSLFLDIRSA